MKDLFALMKALRISARASALQPPAGSNDAWFFAASAQAVLIMELGNHTVVEANPAAATQLGLSRDALIGKSLISAVAPDSAAVLTQAVSAARAGSGGPGIQIHSRREHRALNLTLSVVRAGGDAYLIGHLQGASHSAGPANGEVQSIVLDAIDAAPEGFVVTDLALHVNYANKAFMQMAALNSTDELQGKSIAHWLELSQADVERLQAQIARREAVSVWNSTLRSSAFRTCAVEVSAVAVPDGEDPCWGFRMRTVESTGATAPS